MRQIIYGIILIGMVAGCTSTAENSRRFERMNQFEDKNIVVTDFAKTDIFKREFESNGKLEAVRSAALTYEIDECIVSIEAENGDRVKKGQTLSQLDDTKLHHSFDKSLRQMEKSKLGLEDVLINMGYQLKDTANIPDHMMKIALIRSGFKDAQSDYEMAKIQLSKTSVAAPFDGIVADLKAKELNRSGQYKEFCTLIDDSSFDIVFPLLESEAFELTPGMEVAVVPYAFDSDTIPGVLSQVNPRVDETGMVQAKATVKNITGRLADGMNAKVIVRKSVGKRTIIPKSAVTLRQEKKVVFVCKNDTAYWNYVKVGEENAAYCTIREGNIKPGDEVIIDGNFNLAHLVPVVKMNR
ncbi:efflux RND transporter periplasmic adaptor subunit [Puteibacter caeruleilacunae]|nr:efflux RND transporter periplasmic adaptor subunit [Puteibacter caeruleilacunae]